MAMGKAKGPPEPPRGTHAHGTIMRLVIGQCYGFIRLRGRRDVYFHRADVQEETAFNTFAVGDAVTFDLIDDAISGARAVRVRHRRPRRETANVATDPAGVP